MAITPPHQTFVQALGEFRRSLHGAESEVLSRAERSYEAAQIARTLRHWFLDERPLVAQVLKDRRNVRVRFEVAVLSIPSMPGNWFANDRLDPAVDAGGPKVGGIAGGEFLHVPGRVLSDREIHALYQQSRRRVSQKVASSTLVKIPIMRVEGVIVSVRQAIRYLSHVEHGAHSGVSREPGEEQIEAVSARVAIQDMPAVHASMFAVGRIVSVGLEPLEADIKNG